MLKAKVHRLAGKLILSPKNSPKKGLFLAARNLGFLTLGGAVGQTSGTRSTSRVHMESLGYDGSNKICGSFFVGGKRN